MKKSVLASLLALAIIFPGSVSMVYGQAAPAAQSGTSGQITIKDPQEYNDYTNAVGQSTPAAKAAAIEAFLTKYPNSIVKNDLLEQLMAAYQAAGDMAKTLSTADRLLAVDPGNIRALFIEVYLEESQAASKQPPEAQPIYDKAAAQAQTALNAPKPASMSDADYQKLKEATTPIFEGAIAKDDASKKDFAGAIEHFTKELKSYTKPEQTQSGPGLNDTYLLGQAYAQETPPDLKNAAWFFTRAAQFAPPQAKPQIEKAAEYFYNKYHGSMDGYPAVQELAKTNLFPPPEYNPTPAPPPPSPADLAAQTVASTPDLKTLSLSDQEFILFNGKPEDAQKMWDVLKGHRVEVPGMVISATPESVQLAVTEDNKQSKKADFTVNMKTPLKSVPAIGATVTYDATFDSYSANPPMITLSDGEPPAKTPAARRRAR
jgi:tetratricopeptide (TPR) repeat protein